MEKTKHNIGFKKYFTFSGIFSEAFLNSTIKAKQVQ